MGAYGQEEDVTKKAWVKSGTESDSRESGVRMTHHEKSDDFSPQVFFQAVPVAQLES